MTLSQYTPDVPNRVRVKIHEFIGGLDISDLITAEHLEEQSFGIIQGRHESGWIPFQDGGEYTDVLIANGVDCYITEKQKATNARLYDQVMEEYDGLDEEALHEVLYDTFQPALLTVEMYIREGLVHMALTINYSDAPYYRRQHAEVIKSHTMTMEALEHIKINPLTQALRVKP